MSRFSPIALLVSGALVLGTGVGCSKDEDKSEKRSSAQMPTEDASGRTLWDRLGGQPAVEAVVDELVATSAADPKVNFTRRGTPREWEPTEANVKRLKQRVVEFISENTGGPLRYQGRDMVSAHANMNITNAEFDAFAGHLARALDKFKVPQKEKDELMKIVGSTRSQIVNK